MAAQGSPFGNNRFWIGPPDQGGSGGNGPGRFFVRAPWETSVPGHAVYAGLTLLLLEAWRQTDPKAGSLLVRHFQRAGMAIAALVSDQESARALTRIRAENSGYRSLLYLSPFRGLGAHAAACLSAGGSWLVQPLVFGEGAHGLLAAVDNRIHEKYIRVEHPGQKGKNKGGPRPFLPAMPGTCPGSVRDTILPKTHWFCWTPPASGFWILQGMNWPFSAAGMPG